MPYFLVAVFLPLVPLATDPPEQAKRGQELFSLKGTTGQSCSTCHAMADAGTAIGPDFDLIASIRYASSGDTKGVDPKNLY